MKIAEALEMWGYKDTHKNQDKLRSICRHHPEICVTGSLFNIKKRTKKIYLPDNRSKDTYVHIARAVQDNAHLYPETIGLTKEKLAEQLRQLCEAGIIEKCNSKRNGSTVNYNTTLKTANWLLKRRYQRIKPVIKIVKQLNPQNVSLIQIG